MRGSLRSPGLLALAAYAVLLVLALAPQSLHPQDTVWYIGDGLDSVYFLAWIGRQLLRSPAHLFDANLLYPNPHPAALDAHRILPALLAAPVRALTGNPILAANTVLFAAYLFAAMAGRHLGRRLGLEPWGAWAAGALYAFHTYQINESPRVNILWHGFLPLALAELVCYGRTGERRHAWAVGGLMLLQGYADNYIVLYGALLLGVVALAFAAARPRLAGRRLPGLLLPAAAAALAFSPVALAYLRQQAAYGFTRSLPRGIDLAHYAWTLPTNLVWGPLGSPRIQQQAAHFVGLLALVLALSALLTWRRETAGEEPLLPPRVWVPAAALLALFFVLLSMGADLRVAGHRLGPGPYRLLYHFVPGFSFIRIPERLSMVAMLFVALLAGRAVSLLAASRFRPVAVALALALPAEHLSPLPAVERLPVGREVPAVYRWLAREPVSALAEVPIHGEGLVRHESIEEYFSTYHWQPIIHGYVSYPPLLAGVLRRAAAAFPSPLSLSALRQVGVDTVVVHTGRTGGVKIARLAAATPGLRRLAAFSGPEAPPFDGGQDEVFRIDPAPVIPPAPWPRGVRRRDPYWRYRSPVGNPALAGDGNLATAWGVDRPLVPEETLSVGFGAVIRVSGLVLPLVRETPFPSRFVVQGRTPEGHWQVLATFDDAHVMQLIGQLQKDPGHAAIAFDLGEREVSGLRLAPGDNALMFDGWAVPELEVWVPAGS